MFGRPHFPDNLKVKHSWHEVEPQEVLMDAMAFRQQERTDPGNLRLEVPLSRLVLRVLYGSFVVLAFVLFFQAVRLQTVSGERLAALADANTQRRTPILVERGVVYDRNGIQLAFNRPSFDLVCDKRDMPRDRFELSSLLEKLAGFGVSLDELSVRFDKTSSANILVAENISHDDLVRFESRTNEFPGCQVQENTVRALADPIIFSHLIGYTAKVSALELSSLGQGYSVADQVGKTGVEAFYEKELRGTPGGIITTRDASGQLVSEPQRVASKPGKSLELWLDSGLQRQITRSFENVFAQTGTNKGSAVVLDASTGGILALVSMPSFNADDFSSGITQGEWAQLQADPRHPLFNRAIGGIGYPTGSVIKPLVGLAALQEGVIAKDTSIFAPLEICVRNPYTKQDECFRDWTFHGQSDIKRAIAESVNTFFYIIGGGYQNYRGLGAETIKAYLEKFGWGSLTGVDLPGEGKGVLPELGSDWRLGDTYHFSIGQGPFAVTPLQVASAFVAVANGGTLYEPSAVRAVIDSATGERAEAQPRIAQSSVADPLLLEIIREGMRETVTRGSATGFLSAVPVAVSAKTGTAQTGRSDYDGKDYLYSWTVAFAPSENPEVVLVVVTEGIKEGQVGSLPIARDVLSWYFER